MIHKYLFFIEGEEIQSYKFDKDKIEIIKHKGELTCNLTEKLFWSWWEKVNSYISSEDFIDFCFIGNVSFDFFKRSYKSVEFSEWNIEKIRMVFNEYIKYSSLKLRYVDSENEKYLELIKNPTAYNYQKTAEFNIFTVPSVILSNHLKSNWNGLGSSDLDEKDVNINGISLRSYYLEQLYARNDDNVP